MQYNIRLQCVNAVIVLVVGGAVSLITSTVVAARAYESRGEQATRQGQTITVKGSTRKPIISDKAVWHIHVKGQGKSLPDAFAVLDDGIGRVRDFLTTMGFHNSEINLAAISTQTHYVRNKSGRTTDEVSSFTLSRAFTVTTEDVERVLRSAGRVTELIKDGVFVISGSPQYYYTQLAPLKIELMAAASADARERAGKIAESTGCRLGELRDARMGVLQITQPNSTEVASYGMYDTGTIKKDVRAVVTATFGIAK